MPLLSIIVPVYNVEEYIEECLKSILNQTFQDFELILINDGSKDNSIEICSKYVQKDKRIRILHKKNGGLSSARNLGLKNALGKYISFIDSDDLLADKYTYEILIELMEKNGELDIVQYPYICFSDNTTSIENKSCDNLLLNKDQFFENLNVPNIKKGILTGSACDKLYRKDTIEKTYFNESMVFEDTEWLLRVFEKIKFILVNNKGLYGYRLREGSITTQCMSENKGISYIKMLISLHNYAKTHTPKDIDFLDFSFFKILNRYIYIKYLFPKLDLILIKKWLKANVPSINKFSNNHNKMLIIKTIGLDIYVLLGNLLYKIKTKI